MARLWRAVGIIVAVLLICGVLLAGAGLLTGASPARVGDMLAGDLGDFQTMYGHAREVAEDLLPVLRSGAG